ncbi:hypothetical protein [Desulfolucanica intricata]|uniref:hypothetical protein n=1 Tax=Desulfolucanica intricata TaxID=1285191 RepID=UPI00082CAAF5|nr:hypothetical protein [Desulfolucanica intricata]
MKIEILTQEMSKKPEILTYLANEPDIQARGREIELSDLELDIGDNYLLFTISSWERAEELVPKLFSIKTNAYSPNYFEPFSEQKILVTARAKPILDIIPDMSAIEHLNLEQKELAGTFMIKWQSRDVSVLAKCYLMIEGEIAVCKVRFETVNRETEYQCKECIENIKFHELLTVFTDELFNIPGGPITSGPVIEASGVIEPQNWAKFINHSNARIKFNSETNEIVLLYSDHDRIIFREHSGNRNFILHFNNPQLLTSSDLSYIFQNLDLTRLDLRAKVENITFDLNELIEKMNFKKDQEFYSFTLTGDFTATYNVKNRILVIKSTISLENDNFKESIKNIHTKMVNFLQQVKSCAI